MVTGNVTPDGIFMAAEVAIDGHSNMANIWFLADSGANITAIHPDDTEQLDLPPLLLAAATVTQIPCIGGQATSTGRRPP